jgi:hypothetical protein
VPVGIEIDPPSTPSTLEDDNIVTPAGSGPGFIAILE